MASSRGLKAILTKQPNDVVILSCLRTAVTRATKGGFRDAYDHELLSHVLKATLAANPNLDPEEIDDVAVGVVLAELGGSKAARMAQLHAGFSERTALHTMNRACSSGLAAITSIAHAITVGSIDVGIGAGMESMSKNYGSRAIPTMLWDELKESHTKNARDCIMPMGETSENVAKRYGVSREDQDAFAAGSHKRASKAQKEGLFNEEIVPVQVKQYDAENSAAEPKNVVVDKDDGIRHDISVEKMAKLKPVFAKDGQGSFKVTLEPSVAAADGWTGRQDSVRLPTRHPTPLTGLDGTVIIVEWGSDRSGDNWKNKISTWSNLGRSKEEGGAIVHSGRSLGSAALNLCSVAEGHVDAYWEGGCWAWDVCAGWVILKEAGGIVVDGNPGGWDIAVTHRKYLAFRGAPTGQREIVEEFWRHVVGEMVYEH